MSSRGEFGFIERVKSLFGAIGSESIEGIGDDCAIFPIGDDVSLVITTDMLTEGVHFITDAISADELGRKSLTVNLSDIAAMGATPVASLLSIALPKQRNGEWADSFMNGYHALSKEFNVALIGGDTTSSLSEITINVVAIGRIQNVNIKRRNAAKVGDRIFVGGHLGESAAGLADVLTGKYNTQQAYTHHNPVAQVAEGIWLGTRPEVHAMIDLSDGIASDLLHILNASSVDAQIEIESVPTSVGIKYALSGGEDYKLLFTVDQHHSQILQHEYKQLFGVSLYQIGEIIAKDGQQSKIEWRHNGQRTDAEWRGFTHF